MNSFSNRVVNEQERASLYKTVKATSLALFISRLNNFKLSGHLVGWAIEWFVFYLPLLICIFVFLLFD